MSIMGAMAQHPITLEQAWSRLDAALGDRPVAAETVPLRAARGRILAADARSPLELPPFDKSAMDGYAILADDASEDFRLLETVAAGQMPTRKLAPGTATKVMTGAPVPAGTGRVVICELADEAGGVVRFRGLGGGQNICRRGEDVRAGDVVVPRGRRLSAVDVANCVSCGLTEVSVARPARLAVLTTGEEIVDDPADLRPGRIMNSNGPLLAGLAAQWGLPVALERTVGDDRAATAAALRDAAAAADIVVLTGGVSVGEFDYVQPAMEDVGLTVHFASLAVQPGRPTVLATGAGGKVFFGLPGNPVSVYVMFHLFVLRAAWRRMGAAAPLRVLHLPLAETFRRRKTGRLSFVPARVGPDGTVRALDYHGSAHLAALGSADGLLAVPAGLGELPAGAPVAVYVFAEVPP